eukprot:377093-Pleurochrysis_carterae.AAC.1
MRTVERSLWAAADGTFKRTTVMGIDIARKLCLQDAPILHTVKAPSAAERNNPQSGYTPHVLHTLHTRASSLREKLRDTKWGRVHNRQGEMLSAADETRLTFTLPVCRKFEACAREDCECSSAAD